MIRLLREACWTNGRASERGIYDEVASRAGLLDRDGLDLTEVGEPAERLEDTVLYERGHALGLGVLEHLGPHAPWSG